ncbi:hypothetical protein AAMO2058_000169900 [Amorphochlora amoebiformis]
MTRITVDLIRKKSEHNDGILENLEEISLHQLNIQRIEVLGSCCKHLKILYLQNNLIPKIENLRKMKELVYLNLALNNVKLIEDLQSCESLEKLDLTINFIPIKNLEKSIDGLQNNHRLKQLFLSGNPCCEFKGYRKFVVGSLPWLESLDGKKISKSERILASQDLLTIKSELRKFAGQVDQKTEEDDDKFSAENRVKWHQEDLEEERRRKEEQEKAMFIKQPPDPLKEARKQMSKKVEYTPGGKLPAQRNMPRVKFEIKEDENGNVIATIHAPKYLDTSLIEVDIHPKWFQCIIKGKNLLLHTPEDVHPDKSKIQRLLHNGHLKITMPKASGKGVKSKIINKAATNTNPRKKARDLDLKERDRLAVDYKNIIKENNKKTSSIDESLHTGFLSLGRNYSALASAGDKEEEIDEIPDDLPDLM